MKQLWSDNFIKQVNRSSFLLSLFYMLDISMRLGVVNALMSKWPATLSYNSRTERLNRNSIPD